VHSDVHTTGTFFCSDPLLNKIHDLCKRAVLNNLHSVPTDSPMYEKRGWCDGLLWAAQAADNFGMQPFYSKWLNDIADTQRPNGDIAEVAPGVGGAMDLSWSSVIVVLPWHLYQEYGDRDAIAIHYDHIKRFVDYLSSKATNHLVTGFYGDWVSPGHVMPPEGPDLVACASYYRDVWLLSKMAAVLGRAADEVAYTQLAGEIKTAFNAKYLTASEGAYHTDKKVGYRQTSSAVPLDFGLVPPEHIGVVVSNLVSDVRSRDNHLNTGSFGTAALLPVLTENGQGELAYAVAAQTTFPSWGYWVSQGVTAACEQWTTGETLRSWDHAFLGSVDDWFFKYLAGIQPAKPGYKEINIRPFVPEGLQSASASITSPFGLVSSGWTQESNGVVILKVRVPPNTVAHVWVPGASSPVHVGSGQHTFGGKSSRMK
jgi:alpha-L-rhamnosidase